MPSDSDRDCDLQDRVVAVVDDNLNPPQSERVPWHIVLTRLSSFSHHHPDDIWDALEAAVEAGRLAYDEEAREFWIPE